MYFVRTGASEQNLVYIRCSIYLLSKRMDESVIVKKRGAGVSGAAEVQDWVRVMERRMRPRMLYKERRSKDRFAYFTLMRETCPGNEPIASPFFINHSFSKQLPCARNST